MLFMESLLQRVPLSFHISSSLMTAICFRANELETYVLKDILTHFAIASGQIINYSKSSITFSKNVKEIC